MNSSRYERYELQGLGVSPGIACGVASLHLSGFPEYKEEIISADKIAAELEKLEQAFDRTRLDMENIRQQASKSKRPELTDVLDAQILIAKDREFINQIRDLISSTNYSAVYAFTSAVTDNIEMLSRTKDSYMREMVADIETVSNHILKCLLGARYHDLEDFDESTILFASYFNPGEILEMPNINVSGFVTERGGATSHMGLFAKSLGIPAVVAVRANLKQIPIGSRIVVDGTNGIVIVNPPDDEWENYKQIFNTLVDQKYKQFKLLGKIPSATRDSHHVEISANLDLPTSLDEILAQEKVSIGLYRTEFLYLKHTTFPTEDEQAQVYLDIAKKFAPQPVILRTFDLGSDKLTDYFKSEYEANPALGWRGIRFSLDVTRLFEEQLRAMLKASVKNNVSIMLPMISNLEEVKTSKRILKKVMNELKRKKIPFNPDIKLGIMIETPAAVQTADFLAKEVDFFSIGTNDLTQYTLAVDRNNLRVAKHFKAYHPAVISFIKKTIESGHKAGIEVGICGELAGDPLATKLLVGLGVDALSMSPASIPVVKSILPQIDFEDALRFAQKVIKLPDDKKIYKLLISDYNDNFANNSGSDKAGKV